MQTWPNELNDFEGAYLFYFSLRPIDVEFMKALHEKVNIVPVLAKADTLTPYEMRKKKIKVSMEHLNVHIQIMTWGVFYEARFQMTY